MTSLVEYIAFLETLNEASAIYTDKIIWVSPQYLKLGGYTLDEVKNTSIYSHNHPDDLIDQQKNITHRKNTGHPTSGTWRFRHKDGTYYKVYSKGSVVTLDEGTYYVAIARSHQEITQPEYTSSTLKHDTLSPLTVAQGYLEIIENQINDPETLNLLKKTQTSLEKLHRIIEKFIEDTDQLNRIKQ